MTDINELKKKYMALHTRYDELRERLENNPEFVEWNRLRLQLDDLEETISKKEVAASHEAEQMEGLADVLSDGLKDSTSVGNIATACRDFGCEQLDDLADMLKGGLK